MLSSVGSGHAVSGLYFKPLNAKDVSFGIPNLTAGVYQKGAPSSRQGVPGFSYTKISVTVTQVFMESGDQAGANLVQSRNALQAYQADAVPGSDTRTMSLEELKALYPLLQKADVNEDGKVTKKELQNLRESLERQREATFSIGIVGKTVMDAIATSRAARLNENVRKELDRQIGQIGSLFKADQAGQTMFGKLAATMGDGQSISLSAVADTINAMLVSA